MITIELNNYIILIILSLIILLSHVFDVISKLLKIPSVLLLLGLGILIKHISIYFHLGIYSIEKLIPLLGIIGLIFIVLEGTLSLKIDRNNAPVVKKAFASALFILILSVSSITFFFSYMLQVGLKIAFVNAIPLAVISSAIAVPTAAHLAQHKKEFIIYESIFSDILGIILFNIAINTRVSGAMLAADTLLKFILIIIVSGIFSLLLVLFISKIKAVAKSYIILSSLILAYSAGKLLHLSSLLLILCLGLFMANFRIFKSGILKWFVDIEETESEIGKFKLIVMESTFIIRTFFFVLFGYSIELSCMLNPWVIIIGAAVVSILLFIRLFYLRFFTKVHLFPELFIAPRGLVTILLFYSIPASLTLNVFGKGEILFVIIATSLLMMFAFLIKKERDIEEENYL
ncbi:MAG: cation:proton antiporter [Candidatus Omnitrophota bacterium]|jgi:NhaP-type Na+/H+ or K+/H+ antiporter